MLHSSLLKFRFDQKLLYERRMSCVIFSGGDVESVLCTDFILTHFFIKVSFQSCLPLLPAQESSDIYFQLCMWDKYDILLIAPSVTTWLLLSEIYHFKEFTFAWIIIDASFIHTCWFNATYYCRNYWKEAIDLNSY